MSVSKILDHLWYFKITKKIVEMTANMIYFVALGVGLKCPRKVHLNTQWRGGGGQKFAKVCDG